MDWKDSNNSNDHIQKNEDGNEDDDDDDQDMESNTYLGMPLFGVSIDDTFFITFIHNQIIVAGQHTMKFHQSRHGCVLSPRFFNEHIQKYDEKYFNNQQLRLYQTSKNPPCWNTEYGNGFVPLSFIHDTFLESNGHIVVNNGNVYQTPATYHLKYSYRTFSLQVKVFWQWSRDGSHWINGKMI